MYINMDLDTLKNLGTPESAKKVYRLLKKHELFTPERFDEYEPLRKLYKEQGEAGFVKAWINQSGKAFGEVIWRRRSSPNSYGIIYIKFGPYSKSNSIAHSVHESICKKEDGIPKLLDFATDLFIELKMLYGRIHHEEDWHKKNMFIKEPQPDGSFLTYAVGVDWEKNLPGVYWCNFLGKEYVEWFGRDKILSTPCRELKELENGGVRILAYESPLIYQTEEALGAEKRIIEHLGEEAFFNKSDMHRPTIAPRLDFSDIRPRKPREFN
jgi:hypothetical protein